MQGRTCGRAVVLLCVVSVRRRLLEKVRVRSGVDEGAKIEQQWPQSCFLVSFCGAGVPPPRPPGPLGPTLSCRLFPAPLTPQSGLPWVPVPKPPSERGLRQDGRGRPGCFLVKQGRSAGDRVRAKLSGWPLLRPLPSRDGSVRGAVRGPKTGPADA